MDKQYKNRQFAFLCKRLIRFSLLSLYATVAFNTHRAIAAPVGKLEDWRFSSEDSQLEISLSAPSRPQYFYLSQPPRVVVDLPDTKLGSVPTQQSYYGAVERIRVSQLNDDTTRIVMDLAPGVSLNRNQVQLQPLSWENPTRWVFRPSILASPNLLPPEYQSVGGELPANVTSQLPPGAYSPLQSTSNSPYIPQPPGAITPLQPSAPLPPGTYNNPLQLPPGVNTPLPSIRSPLPSTPVNNGSTEQPTVSVPPITSTYSSPTIPNSVLPPARFPSPSGTVNSSPSVFSTPPGNFPIINTPSNSINPNQSGVIEFGQPFPNPTR
ncbi:MAG: AMIN domain-containing protein [Rivularia sp. (in: Bacteria)]|nr:AMIN domain-containing protein [Rivularia sp. MS3]